MNGTAVFTSGGRFLQHKPTRRTPAGTWTANIWEARLFLPGTDEMAEVASWFQRKLPPSHWPQVRYISLHVDLTKEPIPIDHRDLTAWSDYSW